MWYSTLLVGTRSHTGDFHTTFGRYARHSNGMQPKPSTCRLACVESTARARGTLAFVDMRKEHQMFARFIGFVLMLGVGSTGAADDLPPFPVQVPPIVGTAVVVDAGGKDESSEWQISLTVPRIRWDIVGEMVPKKEWPRLNADVKKVSLSLVLGGPSQLAESRIVDMKGKELSRDQILKRLAKETPVLISVSGEMPDAYFLQLTNAEALMVILGPRDGYPAPELLPAKKDASAKSREKGKK